jgi:hypothetical protein
MAISHISRGFTPPNGPIGSSGTTGKTMNVMARRTSADHNSGHVIFATQLWMSSRDARMPAVATAAAAATRIPPISAKAPSENVRMAAIAVVAENLPDALFSSR